MRNSDENRSRNTFVKSFSDCVCIKIMAIVLLASSAVAAVTGTWIYQHYSNLKSEELSMLAMVTASRLGNHLATPLGNQDIDLVDGLLQTEMEELKISKVAVLGRDGSSVLSGKMRSDDGVENTTDLFGNMDTYSAAKPVFFNQEKVGSITVHLTKAKYHQEMRDLLFILVAAGAIMAITLTLVSGIAMRALVIKPVKTLTGNAESMAGGDFQQRIDYSKKNEIGELGETLEQIQNTFKQATTKLRKNVTKTI